MTFSSNIMWLIVILSFVSGIIFILLVEVLLIYQWWIRKPIEKPSHQVERKKVKNPEELTKLFKKFTELTEEDAMEKLRTPETCIFLNVIFAFLWREWRDSPEMKRLFISKLTKEFNNLIGAKSTKGIIEEINIESYSLGESLPIIKDVRLIGITSQSPEDVPDEIDMALNVTYSGGFYVKANFALALNKSVYLSIKVVEITGKVKLSFRRNPASRWSFSFFEEPEPKIKLDAESRFEGKNVQQLTSLILRHFKKVIRRKYILPNYVIRYKPFMMEKIPQDEQNGLYIHNPQVTVGLVVVQIIRCSRLPLQKKSHPGYVVFCSLSVDPVPFAERKNDDPSLWPVSECAILRGSERRIGLTFHEVTCSGDDNQKKIVVDSIDPDSPAGHSNLKEGDIILEINGQNVIDAKHVSKLIRTSNRRVSILVKRPPSYMPIAKTRELSQKIDTGAPSMDVQNGGDYDENDGGIDEDFINIVMPLIQMRSDQNGSSKGSNDSSSSDHYSPLRREPDVSSEKGSPIVLRRSQKNSENEELSCSKSLGDDSDKAVNTCEKKTKTVKSSKNPQWNEKFELKVEEEHKYLNVLVWFRTGVEFVREGDDDEQRIKDVLLGYVTIPLTDIAVQCFQTGGRFHQQEYVLVSTAYDKVLASRSHLNGHPGLNRVSCGGDITLAFLYKPSFDNDDDSSVKTKVHTSEQIDKEWDEHTAHLDSADFEVRKHNFVDTQFHHPTKCDFCSKKVWTKSGYYCRFCGMACHKKCLQRAQMYTQCYSQQSEGPRQEEADDVEAEMRSNVERIQVDPKTLKKHGVNPSEISSLKDMGSAIQKVKMVGKELYPDLSSTNRKIKLEEMINKLQNEIDEENEKRSKLYQMRKLPKPPYPSSKIDQSIAKSEQKSESLKLLMLQFCSGLESCESNI